MSPSILADFLEGRAVAEQWFGLFVLAVIGVAAFVVLIRQHTKDTRDDGRNNRGGRVRF